MQFNLDRIKALFAFNQAFKTCNIKAKDINSHFLIKERDKNLYVISMNETSEQEILVPTENLIAEENESFLINAQSLIEFLRQFPDEEILCDFDKSKSNLKLKGNVRKIEAEFSTVKEEDEENSIQYVPINYIKESNSVSINGKMLSQALKLTSFSAATNFDLSPLTAVRLHIKDNKLVAQSSDMDRISLYEIELEESIMGEIDILLPKITSEILSDIFENEHEVRIEKGRRHVKFYWKNSVFISRIEDGIDKFPDILQYFNANIITDTTLSRAEVIRALKIAGLIAKDSYVNVKLDFNGLCIVSKEVGKGSTKDIVEVQQITGSGETILSYKYFAKAIESAINPWIDMNLVEISNGSEDIVSLVIKDKQYKHLIFPVKPNDY